MVCEFKNCSVCPEYRTLLILKVLFKKKKVGFMKLNSKDSDVYSVHGVCLLHCELHTVNVRFANTLRLTGLFVKYLFIHNDNHTKKQILVDNAGNCAHGV